MSCDPSSLARWRKQSGPKRLEKLLAAAIQAGLESGAVQVGRYAHALQMRRMRRQLKRLKIYLRRAHWDVARKVAGDEVLSGWFAPLLGLTGHLLVQARTSKDMLYSLLGPEVVCITKGKTHRPYKFSSKVAVAVTNREGIVHAHQGAGEPSA